MVLPVGETSLLHGKKLHTVRFAMKHRIVERKPIFQSDRGQTNVIAEQIFDDDGDDGALTAEALH